MQQKNIGIVCTSPGFGGLEMYTLQLVKALQKRGWQVNMLLNNNSKLYNLAEGLCKTATIQDFQKEKNSASIIKQWNKTIACNLLFTPYNKDIQPLTSYKRFSNKKVRIVYQQHMKVGVKKRDLIHRLRYNMLDLWITPLPYLKEETIEKTTVPKEKIDIIPVGLELSKFNLDAITQQDARAKTNLPQDAFIIGVLGRVDPKKGQDFLIQSLATIANPSIHLLIMGDVTAHEGNDWLQYLHQLVKEHQLEDRVHFRPYQEDALLFYQSIDVFAMSSHGETYGLVTLEAMYCKKPVIGVNTDGTKALLENGKLGWLYELNDIQGFQQQLNAIMQQTEKKQSTLLRAYKTVVKQYDFETTADEIYRLLSRFITA